MIPHVSQLGKIRTARRARVAVESLFEHFGSFVATNPWKVVIITFLVQGFLGFSLLTRTLDNDIEHLYTPRNAATDKNIERLLPLYPDRSGEAFSTIRTLQKPLYADVLVSRVSGENRTETLTDEDLKLVIDTVSGVWFPTRYYIANLSRVCARQGDKCVISASKHANRNLLREYFEIESADLIHDVIGTEAMDSEDGRTCPIKIRFYLRQDTKAYYEDSILWQHAFVREFKEWDNENITVHFSHSSSFLQEVGNQSYPDIRVFTMVFAIFITFCGFVISGGNCLSKRMNIGRISVINVPLAVLGSWGLMSGIGVTFTNIAGVMPLFVVFHELNMAMFLMSAVSNHLDEPDGSKRVIKAVREVAVPSLVMFLTHAVPFAFAVLSKYIAVETFGIYTVVTLLSNFLTHFSFFVGCLAIHEKRIDASRHSCTCKKMTSRDDPENEGRWCCYLCCCTGKAPTEREQVESCLERLPRKLFSRLMLFRPVQVVMVLVMIACVGASIYKATDLKIATIKETDVTNKSYFRHYFDTNVDHFETSHVFTFAVSTRKLVFSERGNIEELLSIYGSIKRLPVLNGNQSYFWLDDFHKPRQTYTSEYEFLTALQEFLGKDNCTYKNDIVFNKDSNAISEFRFYVVSNPMDSASDWIAAKAIVKNYVDDVFDELDDDYDVKVRVHTPSLWLIDSYKAPMYEVAVFAAIQLGVAIILLSVFGNSVIAILHMFFWYVSFSACIVASLTFLGVTINIVSAINIILGLCYSNEVIMYYLFHCMYSEGTNNASRVYNVIQKTTPIIYNTTFGTLLGLTIMLLARSYVFVTVFKVLAVSVAVAWVHSFAFVPPALAVAGAGGSKSTFFKSGGPDRLFKMYVPGVPGQNTTDVLAEQPGSLTANGHTNNGYVQNESIREQLTKL